LKWIGSSDDAVKQFPKEVRKAVGYALYLTEIGERSPHAEIFTGMGNAKVLEIKENAPSGTYRAVYTVEFREYIFVLHAFHKKSKSGIATDKKDVDLIHRRLKEAKEEYKRLIGEKKNEIKHKR
jgi:phage-related protein